MPPHLHPRSRATSTLFTVTLLTSFAVVGLPHILPCPAPRRGYADSDMIMTEDGRVIHRRRGGEKNSIDADDVGKDGTLQTMIGARSAGKSFTDEQAVFLRLQEEAQALEKERRECPVPKPKGIIGEVLGLTRSRPGKTESEKK
ncbi:MAG: hypothetical protein Q9160_006586 [Pyrenula sp. 1 TL-2023]